MLAQRRLDVVAIARRAQQRLPLGDFARVSESDFIDGHAEPHLLPSRRSSIVSSGLIIRLRIVSVIPPSVSTPVES
jgi:hypothetical protein